MMLTIFSQVNRMLEDIHPTDWYNTRFLNYIPQHFTRVKFKHNDDRTAVLRWLQINTVGRFGIESISTRVEAITNPAGFSPKHPIWSEETYIGFEKSSEATMYSMFYK